MLTEEQGSVNSSPEAVTDTLLLLSPFHPFAPHKQGNPNGRCSESSSSSTRRFLLPSTMVSSLSRSSLVEGHGRRMLLIQCISVSATTGVCGIDRKVSESGAADGTVGGLVVDLLCLDGRERERVVLLEL